MMNLFFVLNVLAEIEYVCVYFRNINTCLKLSNEVDVADFS